MNVWATFFTLFASVIVAISGAVLAWRKFGPDTRKITVDTIDVNVTYAGRVRDLAVADWERVSKELDDLRKEFHQYRTDTDARLAEQAAEVRAARAGEAEAIRKADIYAAENTKLRKRVDALESEVAALRSDAGPHRPS